MVDYLLLGQVDGPDVLTVSAVGQRVSTRNVSPIIATMLLLFILSPAAFLRDSAPLRDGLTELHLRKIDFH